MGGTIVGRIFFLFLPRKSAFVEDFSDILTNNKFNKKFGAITVDLQKFLFFVQEKYLQRL